MLLIQTIVFSFVAGVLAGTGTNRHRDDSRGRHGGSRVAKKWSDLIYDGAEKYPVVCES